MAKRACTTAMADDADKWMGDVREWAADHPQVERTDDAERIERLQAWVVHIRNNAFCLERDTGLLYIQWMRFADDIEWAIEKVKSADQDRMD